MEWGQGVVLGFYAVNALNPRLHCRIVTQPRLFVVTFGNALHYPIHSRIVRGIQIVYFYAGKKARVLCRKASFLSVRAQAICARAGESR